MQSDNAALISVDEICSSWLLKKGKTYHSWWKILPIACEAVQELVLTSIPAVHHTELTKTDDEKWFVIPKGFTDWVSVGMRIGDRWQPVGVSQRLMPYPNSCEGGGQFNDQFGDQFKKRGSWKSWLNNECTYGTSDFFADDFFDEEFSTTDTTVVTESPLNDNLPIGYRSFFPYNYGVYDTNAVGELVQGHFTNWQRPDEVTFNVQQGIIMCPDNFPSNKLYLVWVGIGKADTMTYIPVKSQAAIEAYIDWKYAQNKRNNASEARYFKMMFDEQHRLMRARFNNLTESVVRRIVDRGYQLGWQGNNNSFGGSGNTVNNITYIRDQFLILYASAGTFVQSEQLVGKTIGYVIINDVMKNTGFVLVGDMLNFTDGTYFSGGETVTIIYA